MNPTTDRGRSFLIGFAMVVVLGQIGCQADKTHASASSPKGSANASATITPPPGVVEAEQAKYDAMQKAIKEKYPPKK